MSCFREPYPCTKNKTKVELDLSNYAKNLILKGWQTSIHLNLLKKLIYLV